MTPHTKTKLLKAAAIAFVVVFWVVLWVVFGGAK